MGSETGTSWASGLLAGAAAAANWMPAALLVGVTGTLIAQGHDALAYVIGSAGALFLWSTAVAPATGQQTVPAFLATRYRSPAVGALASTVLMAACIILLAAELTAASQALAIAGLSSPVCLAAVTGVAVVGMLLLSATARAATGVAAALSIAIVIALLAALATLSKGDGPGILVSIPAISDIAALEQGLLEKRLADPATFKPYAVPFLRTDALNFAALAVCLSLGLAILASWRGPDGRPASATAIGGSGILLATIALILLAPLAAAAKRSLLAAFTAGVRPAALPDWMAPYRTAGVLEVCGSSSPDPAVIAKACGKGVGPQGFMRWQDAAFAPEALPFAGLDAALAPGLVPWAAVLLAAVALAAATWTARRLALDIAALFAPDVPPSPGRLRAALAGVPAIALAVLIVVARPADAATLLAWAATLAAAGLAPALATALLAANPGRTAALAAISAGAIVAVALIVSARYAPTDVFTWTSALSNAPPAAMRKLASLQDTWANAPAGPGRDALLLQAAKLARDNIAWFGLKPLASGAIGILIGSLVMALGSTAALVTRRNKP